MALYHFYARVALAPIFLRLALHRLARPSPWSLAKEPNGLLDTAILRRLDTMPWQPSGSVFLSEAPYPCTHESADMRQIGQRRAMLQLAQDIQVDRLELARICECRHARTLGRCRTPRHSRMRRTRSTCSLVTPSHSGHYRPVPKSRTPPMRFPFECGGKATESYVLLKVFAEPFFCKNGWARSMSASLGRTPLRLAVFASRGYQKKKSYRSCGVACSRKSCRYYSFKSYWVRSSRAISSTTGRRLEASLPGA